MRLILFAVRVIHRSSRMHFTILVVDFMPVVVIPGCLITGKVKNDHPAGSVCGANVRQKMLIFCLHFRGFLCRSCAKWTQLILRFLLNFSRIIRKSWFALLTSREPSIIKRALLHLDKHWQPNHCAHNSTKATLEFSEISWTLTSTATPSDHTAGHFYQQPRMPYFFGSIG